MAYFGNPRKVFQFIVEVDGIPQFSAQVVTEPEVEIESSEHGDTNYTVKTPGRVVVGDLVIEKLRPMVNTDRWAWNWLRAAQDMITGGGGLPTDIKKDVVIHEMDPSGTVIVDSMYMHGCWVKKISKTDWDKMSSDNVIETVTLSVDQMDPRV